jgi:hypothetical protein
MDYWTYGGCVIRKANRPWPSLRLGRHPNMKMAEEPNTVGPSRRVSVTMSTRSVTSSRSTGRPLTAREHLRVRVRRDPREIRRRTWGLRVSVSSSRGHAVGGLGFAAQVTHWPPRPPPLQCRLVLVVLHTRGSSCLLPRERGAAAPRFSHSGSALPRAAWRDRRRRHEVSCGFSLRLREPGHPGGFGLDRENDPRRSKHLTCYILQQPERVGESFVNVYVLYLGKRSIAAIVIRW